MDQHAFPTLVSTFASILPAARHAALGTVFVALTACGESGSGTGAPSNAAPASAVAPTGAPGPVKRTVEVRNPFGNTGATDNLLADGDFELTGRYDQQPWLAFNESGQGVLNFETGGRCRSGVRCLVLAPGEAVVGWMATPRAGRVSISLWAQPTEGMCKDLRVHVVDMDRASSEGVALTTPEADEAGRCHFEGLVDAMPGGAPAVWLEVEARAKVKNVVVDDVVALPVATAGRLLANALAPRAAAPLRLPFVADWIKRHRRFGIGPLVGPETPAPSRKMRLRER